jgi:hypothetical protein
LCQAYDGSEGDRRSSEGHPVLDRGPGLQPTTLSTAGVAWGTVDQDGTVRATLSAVLRAREAIEASEGLSSADWREPEGPESGAQRPRLDTLPIVCATGRKKPGKKGSQKRGRPRKEVLIGPPPPTDEVELPGVGDVLADGLDLYRVMVLRPHDTYRLAQGEYRSWLAETYRHAARWARRMLGPGHGLTAFLASRAEAVEDCGKAWVVQQCGHCGHEEGRKAYVLNACDSSGCPICGRSKAQPWRAAAFKHVEEHPARRRKGQVSRVYFSDTYTIPVPEKISISTLKAQLGRVRKGVKNVWNKVARFLPRPEDGEYGHYPGRCEEAGMLMGIEVGPSGNLHAHVLRYGARHEYDDLRKAYRDKLPDATDMNFDLIKGNGAELAGGIAEVLKYAVQSSSKHEGEFTHPLVVVLADIALYKRRRIECYGSMKGMKKKAEELLRKEKAEQEIEGTVVAEPCSKCGRNEWSKVTVIKPAYWVPVGWARRKERGPPDGGET